MADTCLSHEWEIRRAAVSDFSVAWLLLSEYFEAVQVMVRDTEASVRQQMEGAQSGVWIAACDGEAAGCIALRQLADGSGEVKRLYVRPAFRRLGIAARLLSALEIYASGVGMQTLYLDSKDDLQDAITFYRRSGYSNCERYNDNPQATVFLTKSLGK